MPDTLIQILLNVCPLIIPRNPAIQPLWGIDFYFDNVGGSTLDAVLERINPEGRIVTLSLAQKLAAVFFFTGEGRHWLMGVDVGANEGLWMRLKIPQQQKVELKIAPNLQIHCG